METISPSSSIKGLPLSELAVVGIIYCIGKDDEGALDFELEELDPALRASSTWGEQRDRCDCCGQRLKYACELVHKPTHKGFFVGRSCAAKIDCLRRFGGRIEAMSVALAERAACSAREKAFRAANPGAAAALDWAATPAAPAIAKDMREKLRRWGSLSVNQVATLVRIQSEDAARRAGATSSAADMGGVRREIVGKLLSLKDSPEPAHYGDVVHHWKSVVDCGNGVRVYGTCPQALLDAGAKVGDHVRFHALVKPSARDPLFGFFSRPTKASIVGATAPVVPDHT
jgi:hypothetical protein